MLSPNFVLSHSSPPRLKQFYALTMEVGKHKLIPRGKQIIRTGSHANCFFYIKKGAFKTVVKTSKKNCILAFTFEDDIGCCPTALLNNLPNSFDVEAIIDSEVLVCEFSDFKKKAGVEDNFNIISNVLVHYSGFLENQIVESLSFTAEERYLRLLNQQPDKLKQLPLSLIACYLGITPERLSRIRKKMKI